MHARVENNGVVVKVQEKAGIADFVGGAYWGEGDAQGCSWVNRWDEGIGWSMNS